MTTRRMVYLWRTIRTGLGFTAFGVGSVVVALGIFPLLRWLPGDHERRAQRLVYLSFRAWIRLAIGLGLFRVQWRGRERLPVRGPAVIVANHPTLIDVVLLIACLPQADCVVKGAAWRNPVLRWVVAGAGYIRNDGGPGLIESAVARVRQGRCLVWFPEGTRSPVRSVGPLRRGAAHVALRTGAPLVPVTIICEPPTLMKGQPWHHVPERTVQFTLEVSEPMWPGRWQVATASEALAARQVTGEVRTIYERRLSRAGA
jgi:1-acyl-sn-glycerol-3-phosphate acyltransferase